VNFPKQHFGPQWPFFQLREYQDTRLDEYTVGFDNVQRRAEGASEPSCIEKVRQLSFASGKTMIFYYSCCVKELTSSVCAAKFARCESGSHLSYPRRRARSFRQASLGCIFSIILKLTLRTSPNCDFLCFHADHRQRRPGARAV